MINHGAKRLQTHVTIFIGSRSRGEFVLMRRDRETQRKEEMERRRERGREREEGNVFFSKWVTSSCRLSSSSNLGGLRRANPIQAPARLLPPF